MQQHSSKTAYVYSDKLLQYRFHDQHPFNQMRLKLTTELLLNANLLSPEQIVQPRIATDDELMLFINMITSKLLSMLHMALSVKMRLRNMD